MRIKNSIKNTIAAMSSNILTIIIGLIAQAVFIRILGTEYLGINGLFTNIISMLGIVELGIGSAIVYNLYKPIANRDKETIKSLKKGCCVLTLIHNAYLQELSKQYQFIYQAFLDDEGFIKKSGNKITLLY